MIALAPAFFAGWLLTVALLAIEHLLWKHARRVTRYMLGTGTICTGCSLAGLLLDNPILAFGPWVIASAGVVTIGWTYFEDRATEKAKQAQTTGQKNGEVIGMARRLERELERDTQRSRHDSEN